MSTMGNSTNPLNGYFFDDTGNSQFSSGAYSMSANGGYITDFYVYVNGHASTPDCYGVIWEWDTGIERFDIHIGSLPSGSVSNGGQSWQHVGGLNSYLPYHAGGYGIGFWCAGHVIWTAESGGATNFQRGVGGGIATFVGGGTEGPGALGAYVVYTAANLPSITSISPTVAAQGQTVTINGSGFTNVSGVTIAGVACSFSFISDSQVTCVVPAGTGTGSLTLVLTTPPGTASISIAIVTAPTISSVSPNFGARGNVVQVIGTQLTYCSATIGGASCSVSDVDDAHLNVTIPNAAGYGSDTITVTNAAGNASSTVIVVAPPTITNVTPAQGPRGGTITLTGTAFTYASGVTIGGVTASFSVTSDTSMNVTIPNTAAYGSDTIVVTNPAGTASNSVNVLAPPTLTSVNPNVAPVGAVVTAVGTGLQFTNSVTVGGVTASFSVTDDQHVNVTIPTGAPAGATTLQVTTPAGSASIAITVGTVYADNSTSWVSGAQAFGDSGTNWQQCSVFVDNGTSWIQVA